MAEVGIGRQPGEVPDDGGLGNADFSAGKKVSKYDYEIQILWRLDPPISLAVAKKHGYLKAPPQKYNYAPKELLKLLPLDENQVVLDRFGKIGKKRR